MTDWRVGDHVDVNGIAAIIRFIGSTEFSDGIWVGVELDTPNGKNDGTVQGVQYFVCPHLRGMFVRTSVPRLIERPSATTAEYPLARAPVVVAGSSSRVAPQKEREPVAPTPVTKGRSMTLRV
jgi:dynactin complex subunit